NCAESTLPNMNLKDPIKSRRPDSGAAVHFVLNQSAKASVTATNAVVAMLHDTNSALTGPRKMTSGLMRLRMSRSMLALNVSDQDGRSRDSCTGDDVAMQLVMGIHVRAARAIARDATSRRPDRYSFTPAFDSRGTRTRSYPAGNPCCSRRKASRRSRF